MVFLFFFMFEQEQGQRIGSRTVPLNRLALKFGAFLDKGWWLWEKGEWKFPPRKVFFFFFLPSRPRPCMSAGPPGSILPAKAVRASGYLRTSACMEGYTFANPAAPAGRRRGRSTHRGTSVQYSQQTWAGCVMHQVHKVTATQRRGLRRWQIEAQVKGLTRGGSV